MSAADPASFTFDRDGRMFYGERSSGAIRIYDPRTRAQTLFFTVPNLAGAGLLGIALHPSYPSQPYIYVDAQRVVSGTTVNQVLRITDMAGTGTGLRVLLTAPAGSDDPGGRLAFGPDGNLYVSVGDAAAAANAQDPATNAGKVLRMTAAGAVPTYNPFAGSYVWATGFRDARGLDWDPSTGRLWASDLGPGCNDELDLVWKAANYAWGPAGTCATPPAAPTNTNQDGASPTLPRKWYATHPTPTGVAFCAGCGLGSDAEGRLFVGFAATRQIRRETLTSGRVGIAAEATVFTNSRAISAVEAGPSGALYFSDSAGIAQLGLTPANTAPPAISGTANAGETLTASAGTWANAPTSLSYQWLVCDAVGAACASIANATGSTYALTSAEQGRTVRVRVTARNPYGSTVATSGQTAIVGPVLLAAGDIASCYSSGDEATASLIDANPGGVLTLGDNAYPDGSAANFSSCYQPSWGRFKARTRPALGNHEYRTAGASAYFSYFGAAAGASPGGYYSYDVGTWHVVVLNSNCTQVPGGCAAGSPEEQWLRSDLAQHPATCTLAAWHHPLFSSGQGNNVATRPLFQALYDAGADLVLNGHDHWYERFAPQDPSGVLDPLYGIREIVAGTGGVGYYSGGPTVQPNSEVRQGGVWGVLDVTLQANGYSWTFLPEAGKTFSDSGSGDCHGAPPVTAAASLAMPR